MKIMIYTITFTPSIDYIADCKDFTLGKTNRTEKEIMYPGGKGINVSIVLSKLNNDSTALGFLAGFTGQEIDRMLKESNVKNEMIFLNNGYSRINVKLRSDKESELNGSGPEIDKESIDKLYKQLDKLRKEDILVLSGSIPKSLDSDTYEKIMDYLKDRDIRIVVDATDKLLLKTLKYCPFLIKPNIDELKQIFNVDINSFEEVVPYAKNLREMGALNVLVSMGGRGAVLIDENNKIYTAIPPKGNLINSVGAGDSMVAGFIHGYLLNNEYIEAFKYGIAAGSASAYSEWLADKDKIEEVLKEVEVVG